MSLKHFLYLLLVCRLLLIPGTKTSEFLRLPYPAIFGGVSAISREHFQLLNGFSNSFWGWGGEDDDMSNRIRYHNLYISRYPLTIARYTMLTHKKGKPSPNRYV